MPLCPEEPQSTVVHIVGIGGGESRVLDIEYWEGRRIETQQALDDVNLLPSGRRAVVS